MPTKQWREENRERLREYARGYYLKNREQVIARSKERNQAAPSPTVAQKQKSADAARTRYAKNAEELRKVSVKRSAEYRKSESNRETLRTYNRDYRRMHRRYANQSMKDAHIATIVAIRAGVLVPATKCDRCGKSAKKNGRRLDAHHWHGYAKENHLDVEWLCIACHAVERRKYV